MRLDKFISHHSKLSRLQTKKAIKDGRVTLNGIIANQVDRVIDKILHITLDGQAIVQQTHHYFMLHKPLGYLCATKDPQHPIVLDLMPEHSNARLRIAGRLDINSTGLLLITDDGDWIHQVTSPKIAHKKTYRVELKHPMAEENIEQFAKGLQLHGEKRLTQAAELKIITPKQVRLSLSEGKYHQVKRMFAAVGNRVIGLHRECIANIDLDISLEPGQYRALNSAEIKCIL